LLRKYFIQGALMITALIGNNDPDYLNSMRDILQEYNIPAYVAGSGGNPSNFRINGNVTISNIFRAKGNEAWKVYLCRFNYVDEPIKWRNETEVHKRNEAFVGLTRSRVWCVVTGIGRDNTGIFAELNQSISQFPTFTFSAFNRSSLRRNHETDDNSII
jgi:superfamily I DNA and RNA helicase